MSHGNRRRGDGRLHPRTVWAIVKDLARRAALAEVRFAGLADALHTHDTRHHYARTVLNRGAGLSVVQDLLGHASPETTKRIYATTDRAVLRAAARAHAPRSSPPADRGAGPTLEGSDPAAPSPVPTS